LYFASPPLIFPGISTLLELAPASRVARNRLLWLHRASPSTTLDKKAIYNYYFLAINPNNNYFIRNLHNLNHVELID
jgi:hypothetical protein